MTEKGIFIYIVEKKVKVNVYDMNGRTLLKGFV